MELKSKIPVDTMVKEQYLFKTFMEHAPALAWINDEKGILHYMNTSFKTFFSLPENAIGRNIYNLYPANMRANCISGDKEVLMKNKSVESFEDGIDENGEINYFKVYKFPTGTENNRQLIGGLAINITGQIKGRMEIIKERNQFQSFNENAPLLAWITDRNGVLLYMNTRFRSSYKYTNAQLNKKIGINSKISEREKVLLPHKEVLAKNKSIEFFHEWTDDQNKVHYFRTFKFPIEDGSGDWLEGGQSIEISNELLAQRELKKSNELFEFAARATRDVIWDWDLEENKIRRTGGYENLFGYKMNDLYEDHNFNKVHKSDLPNVTKIIEDTIKKKDSRWQMEYKYLCADGTYKIVIDQAYIIRDKKGKPVRIIGSMQDVTEERNLQALVLTTEIKKNKDVVSAVIAAQEKERNELSAELHDNVNQLLAATVLYLKTAIKQQVIDGQLINHSLDYVQKAIQELRNISHNLTPSELKMNGLSAALKALSEKLHIPGNFRVRLKIDFTDEKKIEQPLQLALYRIVQEELSNILKHANATRVTIHLFGSGNYLNLKVSDNGKGFDLANMKQGLGITNIYNRAENFGGTAKIISAPGKGCILLITIPLN